MKLSGLRIGIRSAIALGGFAALVGCARSDVLDPRRDFSRGAASTSGSSGSSGSTGTLVPSACTADEVLVGSVCPANVPDLCSGATKQVFECEDSDCPTGFYCDGGTCLINGSNNLQVTLSWDYPEDLDLHVVEPQDGGPENNGCEIWYLNSGNTDAGWHAGCDTPYGWLPGCGFDGGLGADSQDQGDCNPVGWLDRDSNAACFIDDVNIENVLYPKDRPAPRGRYVVRVDFWEDCAFVDSVPDYQTISYAVQVRANGIEFGACGTVSPIDQDLGFEGSGATVVTFDVPSPMLADGGCDCSSLGCEQERLTCSPSVCACLL